VVAFFVVHAVNMLLQAMLLVDQLAVSLGMLAVGLLLAGLLLQPGRPRRVWRVNRAAAVGVVAAALVAGGVVARPVLPELSLFEWAEVVSAVVPALIVLVGAVRMRRSRLTAFRTFKTAILFIIFVTQFFAFYHQQLVAVFGLFVNIVIWLTLRSMIQQEQRFGRADRTRVVG
jgi:hypothetical protein